MTIICAYQDPVAKQTWIGSDSRATTSGGYLLPTTTRKWRVATGKRFAVGVSGYGRTVDVLAAATDEKLFKSESPHSIASAIRELLLADGYTPADQAGPKAIDDRFILVVDGAVYDCDASFALSRIPAGHLWARGSGMDFAIGAANAMRRVADFLAPVDVVRAAIAAACDCDTACGGELFVSSV